MNTCLEDDRSFDDLWDRVYHPFRLKLISRGAKFLGKGRGRTVYRLGNLVWKSPHNWQGVEHNETEARSRENPDDTDIPLARCRLLKDFILAMEYVKPRVCRHRRICKCFPEWTDWVDCTQVGVTRKGALVAYDYGG
jgi:hypothetical protein